MDIAILFFFPENKKEKSELALLKLAIKTLKTIVEESSKTDILNKLRRIIFNSFGIFSKADKSTEKSLMRLRESEKQLLIENQVQVIKELLHKYRDNSEREDFIRLVLHSLFKFFSDRGYISSQNRELETLWRFLRNHSKGNYHCKLKKRNGFKIRQSLKQEEETANPYDKLFKGLMITTLVFFFYKS